MSWGEELLDGCMTAIAAGSLLAAALFTPGCVAKAPETQFTLHLTPEVSANYPHAAAEFTRAAKAWCQEAEECVKVKDKSHGKYEVRMALDGCVNSIPEAVASQSGRSIYLYQQRCSDMLPINYRDEGEPCGSEEGKHIDVTMFEAAAHELGHLLGHPDNDGPENGVMYSHLSCRAELDFDL